MFTFFFTLKCWFTTTSLLLKINSEYFHSLSFRVKYTCCIAEKTHYVSKFIEEQKKTYVLKLVPILVRFWIEEGLSSIVCVYKEPFRLKCVQIFTKSSMYSL